MNDYEVPEGHSLYSMVAPDDVWVDFITEVAEGKAHLSLYGNYAEHAKNGETPGEFANRLIRESIETCVHNRRVRLATAQIAPVEIVDPSRTAAE